MTRAERAVAARRLFSCPRCHATAGRPCRKRTAFSSGMRESFTGGPMKGVHDERRARLTAVQPHRKDGIDVPDSG